MRNSGELRKRENEETAVLIRVGRSWVSPHRVIYKGHDKFYARNSSGKYPLDVGELRSAFTLSATITERIRRFREDRISSLYANETPVPMKEGPKIVLHLLPVVSFSGQPVTYATATRLHMRPMHSNGWDTKYTLEGFLNYAQGDNVAAQTYVHLYRNGIIEAVEGSLIAPVSVGKQTGKYIDSFYEHITIEVVDNYIEHMKGMGIPTPVFVFLTLVEVKGCMLRHGFRIVSSSMQPNVIDRDVLLLPEVTIENYDIGAAQLMKPVFDGVWNTCGYARSFNYDDKGEWKK
ncbi:MAG: hypothetical protein ACLQF0_09115 [Dissulfurispiraceae bacterium]